MFLQTTLDGLEVFELEFGIDNLLVAHRVDGAVNVGDVLVLKASEHVDDGIGLAYVAQELVAESLALAGTFDKSGYIHYLACRWHYSSWMHQLGEFSESFVGHGNHAHVGLNSTKGEVCRLCLCTRQAVEKC